MIFDGLLIGILRTRAEMSILEDARRRHEAENRRYQEMIAEATRGLDQAYGHKRPPECNIIDLAPEDVREVKPAPQLEHQP